MNLDAQRHGVPDHRQTAIMQLAHGSSIWIFSLSSLIASNEVPAQLKAFLANPRIIKVGKNVATDLKYLEEDFKSAVPFVGGCNIAQMAKDRNVVDSARVGLADLSQKILSCTLDKDQHIRVSNMWSGDLTRDQKAYAAQDVWASLQIYNALLQMNVPTPVDFTQSILIGYQVYVYQPDRTTIIAHGTVSPHSLDRVYDGINISSTRTVITIVEVYVSGAIMDIHRKKVLGAFGAAPFDVICQKAQVQTYVPGFVQPAQTDFDVQLEDVVQASIGADRENEESENSDVVVCPDDPLCASLDIGFNDKNTTHCESPSSGGNTDSQIEAEYRRIAQELFDMEWPSEVRSGVLKDIFHVFHMIPVSKFHGLQTTFQQALRDAIFLPDKED